MKILFLVSHLNSGGAERTVSYLSEYLSRNNIDVTVLSLSDDIFYNLGADVHLKLMHIKRSPQNAAERLYLIAKRFYLVKKHLKKNRYDAVFCMIPNTAKYLLRSHKTQGFKLITSERNNPAVELQRGELKLKKKIFNQADGIVFQTERAKLFYDKSIQQKGIVIHNAIGNKFVYNVPKVINREKKITAIGRLSEQKDYPTLFGAFSIVLKSHPDFRLEIFGDDSQKETYNALLNELGIKEKVFFMGIHNDAVLKAANSACYVMSSKFEGMPNALMEAMAAGLPCVSTDCPNGPSELIDNGTNGLLVPVGDAYALSNAMLKMIEDCEFAEMCGTNARKILETHSIDIKAKEYMNYILKICNGEQL